MGGRIDEGMPEWRMRGCRSGQSRIGVRDMLIPPSSNDETGTSNGIAGTYFRTNDESGDLFSYQ